MTSLLLIGGIIADAIRPGCCATQCSRDSLVQSLTVEPLGSLNIAETYVEAYCLLVFILLVIHSHESVSADAWFR